MRNPKKLDLTMDERIVEAIRNCKSGILRLMFDIRDGEVMGCFDAAIGPPKDEHRENLHG